jgi:phosphonate transport system substrate-binding protein
MLRAMAKLRMGVALSELGRRTKQRDGGSSDPNRAELDAFCACLSRETGLEITGYAAPRYDRLLLRLKLAEVDLAWLSPVVALAAARAHVRPVALPERSESTWYWAALFSRADSPIRSLSDLHRAHVVWVDPESASGFLVIRAALHADGVDLERGFASQSFARSHDAMVRQVLASPVHVGSTYLHLDASGAVVRAGWGRAEVQVLKRAGPIPSDVLAAASSLSETALGALGRALCEAPAPDLLEVAQRLFGARRFVRADRAQLAHLEALERYLIRTSSLPR